MAEQLVADGLTLLAEYGIEARGVFQVSASETADLASNGVAALKAHILDLAEQEPKRAADASSFRMTLDRAFSVKGAGCVVTGTVISGNVCVGDSLFSSGQ